MTRRVCLSAPPVTDRIDGVSSLLSRPLPRIGDTVEIEVLGVSKWKRIGWVVELDEEKHEYSVEVIRR